MAYVLKQVDDESPEVNIYAGTVKFGSSEKCDLVIKSDQVLPVHGEIYRQMPEYRLVASHSAFIEINDQEVLKWPAVLSDGDVITIGDVKFNFSIIQPVIKRSRKSAISSILAAGFLASLLLFELLVMVWLPNKLREDRAFIVNVARQYVLRQIDSIRGNTYGLKNNGSDTMGKLQKILLDYENDVADYLRKYGEKLDLEQAIEVRKDLYFINLIVETWPDLCENFLKGNNINPTFYFQNLASSLMKQNSTSKKG